MIELYNLPLQDRITLARKSEPFFLAYKKNDAFTSTFKSICSYLTTQEVKEYEAEVWTLISATSQTIRYDSDSCQLSFSRDNYMTANRITNKKIDVNRMVKLVDKLEAVKLLTKYKGFNFDKSTERGVAKSMRSCLVFSSEWFNMFDVTLCKRSGTARQFDLVILKDKHGNIISTKGMRGVGQEKALLKEWNKLLYESEITIDNTFVKPTYTTVFNNSSLNLGGRLYAGAFSTESNKLRPTITIKNNPTCEIDYKNNHFRILYNEYGIDYQQDAYEMPCPDGWCSKELRLSAKFAGLMMLNAKSKSTAKKALFSKLQESSYYNKDGEKVAKNSQDIKKVVPVFQSIPKTYETVNYVVEHLEKAHSTIRKHFYKAEWDRLQNIDSRMAKQVVKVFTVKGIPVLTYHDSFVCESVYKEMLIQAMKEAWEIVLGDSKGFGYDIEFCNTKPTETVLLESPPLEAYQDVLKRAESDTTPPTLNAHTNVQKGTPTNNTATALSFDGETIHLLDINASPCSELVPNYHMCDEEFLSYQQLIQS